MGGIIQPLENFPALTPPPTDTLLLSADLDGTFKYMDSFGNIYLFGNGGTGPTGPTGSGTGATGATGATGPQGPTGSVSVSVISITWSTLVGLASIDALDLGSIYKVTDVGSTYVYPGTPAPRGDVYLRATDVNAIDPNGTWVATFSYTSRYVIAYNDQDLITKSSSVFESLIISTSSENSYPYAQFLTGSDVSPVIGNTAIELLSATLSFGTDVWLFGDQLYTSIMGASNSSGWYVYDYVTYSTDNITQNLVYGTTNSVYKYFTMVLSSLTASALFNDYIYAFTKLQGTFSYGNSYPWAYGYDIPFFGFHGGQHGLNNNFQTNYSIDVAIGMDTTTYSLSCIYNIQYNDLSTVYDNHGNEWHSSFLQGIFNTIYVYPINMSDKLDNQFTFLYGSNVFNCIIKDAFWLTPFTFVNSGMINSSIGISITSGNTIFFDSSVIYDNTSSLGVNGIFIGSMLNNVSTYDNVVVYNSTIQNSSSINTVDIYQSVISNSNIVLSGREFTGQGFLGYSVNAIVEEKIFNKTISKLGDNLKLSVDISRLPRKPGENWISLAKFDTGGFWDFSLPNPGGVEATNYSGVPTSSVVEFIVTNGSTFSGGTASLGTFSTTELTNTLISSVWLPNSRNLREPLLISVTSSGGWELLAFFDKNFDVAKWYNLNLSLSKY